MPASRVADYELVRSLGEGSHGEAFLAIPPQRLGVDDEHVVVKVLAQTAAEDGFQRVVDQLRFVASVASPHLARLLDAGYQSGVVYYATEYYAGGSLASPSRPLERGDVLTCLAQAAHAAHALHEAGAAHRGIKPANVLIVGDEDGAVNARLADPALAPVLSPGQTTTGGERLGALEFIEPGILRGEPAGRASDIWSLGGTLHRTLSGQSIYEGPAPEDIVSAIRSILTTAPTVSGMLPPGEAALVQQCLAEDRADRFATALEFAERLEELAAVT
ncbi:MAG: protein kinase [Actinobacteria bacterium]|nr:protein kinase [Actinomycetota bacterium]